MLKLALLSILLVLVAQIYAQCSGECCTVEPDFKLHCVGVGKTCDNTNPLDIYVCKDSYEVGTGSSCICTAYANLNEGCSSGGGFDQCFDDKNDYDLSCSSGTCKYAGGAVGPGETCPTAVSDYPNSDPCISGESCPSCGTAGTAGTACNEVSTFCAHGFYCGEGTNNASVCVARGGAGSACGTESTSFSSLECNWDLYCSGGECRAPFSVASGSACNSILDCNAGLLCSSSGQCTSPQNGAACSVVGANTCPSGHSCVCKGDSGDEGTCQASVIDSKVSSRVRALLSCLSASSCTADLPWTLAQLSIFQHSSLTAADTPDACYNKNCRGQVEDLADYYRDLFRGPCDGAVSVSIATVLVFALAVLALMF